MKKAFLIIMGLSVAVFSNNTNTPQNSIKGFIVPDDGSETLVNFATTFSSCEDGAYIDNSRAGAPGILSTLLTQYAAGRPVILWLNTDNPAKRVTKWNKTYCAINNVETRYN